jgi:formiminotetrahydrofolate cyclodeaminase
MTARLCLDVLKLASEVAAKGNVNSASDAGVAGLVARAGVEGAGLNVLINLGSVTDQTFKDTCRQEVARLEADAEALCSSLQERVTASFQS